MDNEAIWIMKQLTAESDHLYAACFPWKTCYSRKLIYGSNLEQIFLINVFCV